MISALWRWLRPIARSSASASAPSSPKRTPEYWQQFFADCLAHSQAREMASGYDEKTGLLALADLSLALQSVPMNMSASRYVKLVIRAMLRTFERCTLQGEYSSGQSSMGSALRYIAGKLPSDCDALHGDLITH